MNVLSTQNSSEKTQINFSELMDRILSLLSEKEQDVIRRRFSLGGQKKETLDRIGQSYSITRERVRQIESVSLKKLARISMYPSMRQIHDLAFAILVKYGKVMTEEILLSEMLKNMNEVNSVDVNAMTLAMRVSERLVKQEQNQLFRSFWRTSDVSLKDIKQIIKKVHKCMQKKGDTMSADTLSLSLGDKYSSELLDSVLRIDWNFRHTDNGWGLSIWRHINPRSIKDKILITFRKISKAMHFEAISNHVLNDFSAKKLVTKQAIHNELIRHDEFVLVGRGLYALGEWGLSSGTVCDLIIQIFEENDGPMKRQDIITEALNKRNIRIGTISLNLQKYDFFKRVGRAVYMYDENLDTRKRKRKVIL